MRRIMVVEDEFLLAAHIAGLLEDAGFEVIGPTGTLDEALKLAKDEELDGALLDVNIVGGPINDVAETLAGRGVPFVFVTGYARDHLPLKFRETTIVAKPFDDRLLVGGGPFASVAGGYILRSREYFSPGIILDETRRERTLLTFGPAIELDVFGADDAADFLAHAGERRGNGREITGRVERAIDQPAADKEKQHEYDAQYPAHSASRCLIPLRALRTASARGGHRVRRLRPIVCACPAPRSRPDPSQ